MARRGRRGDGTVYWSKRDRRWIARVPLLPVEGRRRDKREKHDTEDEAKAALKRMRRVYAPGRTTETLGQWLREWLPIHCASVRASTAVSYRGHVRNHIDPLLGGVPLAELGPADVRRLIRHMQTPHVPKGRKRAVAASAETVRHTMVTLSAALNAAEREGLIGRNPVPGVPLPRVDREPVDPMRPETAETVLNAVAGTWLEHPVRLLLGSGIRLGEAMGLDQGDLLLDQGYVRVRRSKTAVRAVPISDDAVEALKAALKAAPRRGPREPVFFAPKEGGRMRAASVSHAFPRRLVAVGVPRMTVHALRHGAATLMLADGTPMRVISEQLGHRNPAITARVYAHVIPDAQRTALGSLPKPQPRSLLAKVPKAPKQGAGTT